ncbi:baculoviral iap repeat-containing protein 7-b [Plakobranchus ocellatus]|uniref:Baculoviral iap repeat-containing protein 7-b n=1 Tax=Plakobranchus ocellatus TaxID=259542 RepID=A0AAV4AHQ0_9GAST|nr:baculoviral iap repeat-containing protein 7-b [Plakobranchus ocellatus]
MLLSSFGNRPTWMSENKAKCDSKNIITQKSVSPGVKLNGSPDIFKDDNTKDETQKLKMATAERNTLNWQQGLKTSEAITQHKLTDLSTGDALVAFDDSEEYEHKKHYLLSVAKSHNGFLESTARRAVEFMLSLGQAIHLIDLAAAYFFLKFGRSPSGRETFEIMIDTNFQEKGIIKLFDNFSKTETGAIDLESPLASKSLPKNQPLLQEQRKSDGNKNTEGAVCNAPESREQFNDQSKTTTSSQAEKCSSPMYVGGSTASGKSLETKTNRDSYARISRVLLEKENTLLKNKFICKLCKERPISTTFLPCGHFMLCQVCSKPCQINIRIDQAVNHIKSSTMDISFPLPGINFEIATVSRVIVTKPEHLDPKFFGLVWVVDSRVEWTLPGYHHFVNGNILAWQKDYLEIGFNLAINGRILKKGS